MSVFDAVQSDLDRTVAASVRAGDDAWNAGDYASAVAAYQRAGNTGATGLGPEIDAAGFPNATQTYTQEAWQVNSQLAKVNTTSPASGDALAASALAQKMVSLYAQAISAGRQAETNAPSEFWPTALAVGGVAIVAGTLFGILKVREKRAGGTKTRRMTRASRRTTVRP